jgi:pyruvate ferredoxin oxidoreductase alpha subunit
VVALGSVLGTIEDVVDARRAIGRKVGAVGIGSFRPFPLQALREAVGHAKRVVVVEKALSVGIGGPVSANVRTALAGLDVSTYTVIAGLGGRPITQDSLHEMLELARDDDLEPLTFLDINWDVVNRELGRQQERRRSGPEAENILRDLGAVAAGPV